nr:hypothetical protein CFP56_02577 [Quercus suber]
MRSFQKVMTASLNAVNASPNLDSLQLSRGIQCFVTSDVFFRITLVGPSEYGGYILEGGAVSVDVRAVPLSMSCSMARCCAR